MARPGYSLGTKAGGGGQVKSLILSLTGNALEAFVAGTSKIQMPETGQVIGIHLNVGRLGGTYNIGTVDVLEGATSLLTAVFDIAAAVAGTPIDKEGSALAAAADVVAKDAVISVTSAVTTGTSPTWGLAVIQIDYVPLGD